MRKETGDWFWQGEIWDIRMNRSLIQVRYFANPSNYGSGSGTINTILKEW